MGVLENVTKLRSEIPSYVEILAATKNRSGKQVLEAIDAGITLFGENYVQEAEKKFSAIKRGSIELWFIGHLQQNKINRALRVFDVINVDSYETAKAVTARTGNKTRLILEVNIGEERQKHGCMPGEAMGEIGRIKQLGNAELIGIMCMAPSFDDENKARPYFQKMKSVFEKVKDEKLIVLSMGMSHDYKAAVAEGSNMIRVGSLIFG